MAKKDYYEVLGVSSSATQDEIKSAYRKLAKQYHPDLHPGDDAAAEKFKQVNEAYSVVGDPDKRQRYDRGEMDMDGQGGFNPFGGGGFSATGFDDIFDMFSGAFGFGGGSRRRSQTSAGSDIQYSLRSRLWSPFWVAKSKSALPVWKSAQHVAVAVPRTKTHYVPAINAVVQAKLDVFKTQFSANKFPLEHATSVVAVVRLLPTLARLAVVAELSTKTAF